MVPGHPQVLQKYLDVSGKHTARYTFNLLAKLAGASLEKRQGLLMHGSPATTQTYDEQLERSTKKYQEQTADLFGL